MQQVKKIVERVRKIFEEEKDDLGIPFFYSFPKNCCEGASCFLALILMDEFPDKKVLVIHSSDKNRVENHFWVEVNGFVFDLTVDQFESVYCPIYGESEHPLAHQFTITERQSTPAFFLQYCEDCLEYERSNMIYLNLKQKIKLGT